MKNFRWWWCCFFFSCFSAAVIPFKGRKTNRAKDARNFGCLCNQTTSIVFFSFFPFLFLFFLLFVAVVDVVIFFGCYFFCNTNFNSNSNINPSLNITPQMYIYLLYPKKIKRERRVKIYVKE